MIEIANKILDFLKELLPTALGWFASKQDSKIEQLKEENEKLKEFNEIDNNPVDVDVFDARVWK